MMITNTYWIQAKREGGFVHNLLGYEMYTNEEPLVSQLRLCLKRFKSKYSSETDKNNVLRETRKMLLEHYENTSIEAADAAQLELQKTNAELNIQHLIDFFTEFSFSPNFRFINTFSNTIHHFGSRTAKDYVANYFALTDNAYYTQICEKMKSSEFDDIVSTFYNLPVNKVVNKRFKLYYGSQGTGKTTLAMDEANNNCTVCHSAMLPSDLMEDFEFEDGKANFKPSQLYNAMLEGKTIALDEINLLPFESLRFLQSILDGKSSFVYKGKTVDIADGFQIIGTMNLQVNGMTYALPEPLVDRASELKEFKLSPIDLVGAIL